MICSSSSPPIRRRPGEGRGPRGFTLVELVAVVLILAFLIALLLPALSGAVKTARNAAVGAEINQLAQALASFKSQYGDYPPSRIYLAENGDFGTVPPGTIGGNNSGDITYAQLALRSVAALRKFFPRVVLNTSGGYIFGPNSLRWYDFNGNGVMDGPYILNGHECLAFFLGGIPLPNPVIVPATSATTFSMTGFGKDPINPFSNNIFSDPRPPFNGAANSMYSGNRQPPFFEFANNRLILDPSNTTNVQQTSPGVPGYFDSLGNSLASGQVNFYAYFSAYGNGGYDPNDVNFAETDAAHIVAMLAFRVNFPILVPAITGVLNTARSSAPNPYTSGTTVPPTGVTSFLNPQSFQIISSGIDGQYGVGGQYTPNTTGEALPLDTSVPDPYNTSDTTIRVRERDNVTNFHNGKLE